MKRNLIGILSLVALALLVNATAVYAQSDVKANVPFAFKVGKAQLPAGTYEIREGEQNTVMIHNTKTSAAALSMAQHEYPSRNASPRLVFHRVGDQYFLAEIWGGAGEGLAIPASKLEKEKQVASGPSNTEEIVIALNR